MKSSFNVPIDPDPILPRWVLFAAGGAMLTTIVIAANGHGHVDMPPAQVNVARNLIFVDAADGGVLVSDATTHQRVAQLAPGTNGFIRASLRGLAHSGGHEVNALENHPFLLTGWSDGRLTLDDPVSHRRLDLEAFGSDNAKAFAALLTVKETP